MVYALTRPSVFPFKLLYMCNTTRNIIKLIKYNNDFRFTVVGDIEHKMAGMDAARDVKMSDLYEEGTHEVDVFIEKCVWKGRSCSLEHFEKRFT